MLIFMLMIRLPAPAAAYTTLTAALAAAAAAATTAAEVGETLNCPSPDHQFHHVWIVFHLRNPAAAAREVRCCQVDQHHHPYSIPRAMQFQKQAGTIIRSLESIDQCHLDIN